MNEVSYNLPTLGPEMKHGIISHWKVHEGDQIKEGDVIAEVETEKHNMDINAWEDGVVTKLLFNEGDNVKVGTPIFLFKTSDPKKESKKISPRAKKILSKEGLKQSDIEQINKSIITGDDILAFERKNIFTKEDRQNLIAKIVEKSKKTIPHFYIEKTIDHTNLLGHLKLINKGNEVSNQVLPIAYYIKAISIALINFPTFNSSFNRKIIHNKDINISLITSTRDGGIIAPVIKNPHLFTTYQIMKNIKDLVTKAREDILSFEDVKNGTISLTSLGEQGVDKVYGIIYPPQVAIIGIGTVQNNHKCCWTMSVDHRVSNGIEASKFLLKIEKLILNPEQIETYE